MADFFSNDPFGRRARATIRARALEAQQSTAEQSRLEQRGAESAVAAGDIVALSAMVPGMRYQGFQHLLDLGFQCGVNHQRIESERVK